MIGLDTSVLVRYTMQNEPAQAGCSQTVAFDKRGTARWDRAAVTLETVVDRLFIFISAYEHSIFRLR